MSARYTQCFALHLRLGRRGCAYSYHILCDGQIIGTKQMTRPTRASPTIVSYQLLDGQTFGTAEQFIAAYEAQQAGAQHSGEDAA